MRTEVENRAIELGEYIVQSGATVRSAAKRFGISKSTVHTVVTKWNGFAGGWSREERQHFINDFHKDMIKQQTHCMCCD